MGDAGGALSMKRAISVQRPMSIVTMVWVLVLVSSIPIS